MTALVPAITQTAGCTAPSCAAIAPVANPKPVFVNVTIDAKTVLKYNVPDHIVLSPVSGNLAGNSRIISLIDSPQIPIPHGTHVMHGSNRYIVVEHFVNDEEKKKLPEENATITANIHAGIKIHDPNGIPVALAAAITVEIPGASLVRLAAGTRLQQTDGIIRLQLAEPTTVRIA